MSIHQITPRIGIVVAVRLTQVQVTRADAFAAGLPFRVRLAALPDSAAVFKDIAFDLQGRKRINAMWAMICDGDSDIRATFDVIRADDDQEGQVKLVDEYTFRDTHRPVRNAIDSQFRFRDGLIIEHHDFCDPRQWAAMALGGIGGFLAGRIRLLRSWKAQKKLQAFVKPHPEYQ